MAVIGTFVPTRDGGWSGSIRTLMIDTKIRFVPNDNQANETAPAFRIFAGKTEVGAAWARRSSDETPRNYLSVKLNDPCLNESISAALFEADDSREAVLVWSQRD